MGSTSCTAFVELWLDLANSASHKNNHCAFNVFSSLAFTTGSKKKKKKKKKTHGQENI